MKMINILFFLCSHALAGYELEKSALHTHDYSFVPHHTPAPFASYLSQEVSYQPVKKLLNALIADVGPLKDRGEAHITVVTPIEFDKVLSSLVTIQEINSIALKMNIQAARFLPVCIGSGEAQLNGINEKTYFVVVKSDDLLRIRHAIHRHFIKKGGRSSDFNPERFFPHITLGFTKDDLHESNGVIKNENSCLPNGTITII